MTTFAPLKQLDAGMQLLVGGDRLVTVPETIAQAFEEGDALLAVEETGELLHVPQAARRQASEAVARAVEAFGGLRAVSDAQVVAFHKRFAALLADEAVWSQIRAVNDEDVRDARARGRSVTRLVADARLRDKMIAGLYEIAAAESSRGQVVETIEHTGWTAQLLRAELGVVAFVFEGRPNVLADATGLLRGGNTVVFRIGSDALRTARAMLEHALQPALRESGLPEGAVSLVDSRAHAAGWALFSDRRLALAVARGSGRAVRTLASVARQGGIPVSVHGTGGAWLVAGAGARPEPFASAVFNSLDRKVCNTLNVCCIPQAARQQLLPVLLDALRRAGERRGQAYKLHVVQEDVAVVPAELFEEEITVVRAEGAVKESRAQPIAETELGHEWEWEETPEITLKIVRDSEHAAQLFNRYSPQFIACIVSDDEAEHERFYQAVNAPFVGNGFTRWVDGQFALRRPELGLSSWEGGRLFARGGIVSGDGVFTLRTRAHQTDPDVSV